MTSLIKLMSLMAILFASTFLVVNGLGLLSIESIERWLTVAESVNVLVVAAIVIALLFLDLFIAVPTLSIMMLGGYFAGPYIGALAAFIGTFLAGVVGYGLSYFFGDQLLNLVIKDDEKQQDLRLKFREHGVLMILLSRALPILPEVTACMAGISHMKFLTFVLSWVTVTLPYTLIAAYAGSISSLDNPKPAILTAVLLTSFFWCGRLLLNRYGFRKTVSSER